MQNAKKWASKNAVIIFMVVILLVFSIINPTFRTPSNFINITSQMSINALLATGITYVIIIGGIDISVGSVAAFAGIFSAFMGIQFPAVSSSIIGSLAIQLGSAMLIGGICGLVNGLVITKLNVVPMIATLAMMTIARGFAYVVTGGQPVYGLSNNFSWLGAQRILKTASMPQGVIPIITIFTIIVVVLMHLLLSKTVFGRHVYAVGSNEKVAHLSGIDVDRVKISSHVICSVMAAIGGVCVTSKLNNGQPGGCDGYEMFAIAATVLGGTSLAGGSGSVLRAMIGVVIIAATNIFMNLQQVESYWQKIVIGVIILVAVVIDAAQKKQKN